MKRMQRHRVSSSLKESCVVGALGLVLLAGCATEPADGELATTEDTLPAAPAPYVPQDPRIIPIPDIPAPLRGCWVTEYENSPGERRLIVTATTLTKDGREARADYVNRIGETWIDGRFAGDEGETIATMLELNDDGTMILREGDAGSYDYNRCRP